MNDAVEDWVHEGWTLGGPWDVGVALDHDPLKNLRAMDERERREG